MRIAPVAIFAMLAFAAAQPQAQAQDWPQRQVTIVVPFSAGGTTDMFGRILAQGRAAEIWDALHRREPRGCRRQCRSGDGRAGGEGRLYAAGRHLEHARHQSLHLQEPPARYGEGFPAGQA